MNPTEHAAHAWLERRGYDAAAITFRSHLSPDFLTIDGQGWEAKLIRCQRVTFTLAQVAWMREHGQTTVLFFQPDATEPWDVVPFEALPLTDSYRGIALSVMDTRPHRLPQVIRTRTELQRLVALSPTDRERRHWGIGIGLCSCGWVGDIAAGTLRQISLALEPIRPEPEAPQVQAT